MVARAAAVAGMDGFQVMPTCDVHCALPGSLVRPAGWGSDGSLFVTTAQLIVVGAAVFIAAFLQIVAGFDARAFNEWQKKGRGHGTGLGL